MSVKKPVFLNGDRILDFSGRCLVMAVINCNEDSFYEESRALLTRALEKALKAEEDGADIIDFGSESTRPGACYIDENEEMRRLIPAIELFRKHSTLPVSVDTRKASVAKAALDCGADIINDISAMEDDPLMAGLCAEYGTPVILTHKKGKPSDMRQPVYFNVVSEVKSYLFDRVKQAERAGIHSEKIFIDPGFGFGKSCIDNLTLLSHLAEIAKTDYPLVAALSRKSFIGEITGRDVKGRLAGSLAANTFAVMNGADIIRVHDVNESVDLVKILNSVRSRG